MKKISLLLAFLCVTGLQVLFAQTRDITGNVTSAEDGSTVPGASIVIKGTTVGTITDMNGEFRLRVPQSARTLVISFVGMTSAEVDLTTAVNYPVVLKSTQVNVDEVIVVGYGTAKKVGTIVGSITQVTADKLKEKPVANVFDGLQGRVAGLQVYTSNGEPSQLSSVRLHGRGSLGAGSEPLYVLDGGPMNSDAMLSLNSNDFESITILKDASATSIYGSRAANGVIFLTTKRGTRGEKGKVVLNSQYGYSQLANLDYFNSFMNSKQLTDFWVAVGYRTQAQVDQTLIDYPNDYLWYKDYYKDKAPTYQGDLSISGGSDKTTYYISGSYFFQEGLAVRSGLEKYTLRSNITSKVNNWLSFGINIAGGYDIRASNPYATNNLNGGLSMLTPPFYSPYDKDGVKYPDMIPGVARYNPEYLIEKQPINSNTVQINGTGYVQINPVKGLTIKSQAGLDAYDNRYSNKRMPSYKASLNNGLAAEYFYRNIVRTITNTIEYKFNVKERHQFTVLGGHEGIDNEYTSFYGTSTGQTDDRLVLLQNGPTGKDVTSGKTEYAYLSYFGRADYGLDDKYFFDLSLRNDASSRFGKNNRSANFYATGFMWNAKKESFLKDVGFLTSLNIKASIGTAGNSSIGNYANLALVGTNQYNASTGWNISTPGNPDLGWENQKKTTFGLKFALLNDRFRFNIEYYNRVTKNMLISVPFPYTSGFGSVLSNVGALKNSGIDIAFDFDIVKTRDYFVTPYINYSYNKEEVTELFQGLNYWIIPNTGVCWAVGKPVSFFYPLFAGIDPADGAPMWYKQGPDKTVTTKTETTKVFNSAALEQNIGLKRYAPVIGGFGLNAGWKGITLQADFAYALGKNLINNDRYFMENPTAFSGYNQTRRILDYWKQPGDQTLFPKYGTQFTQFDSRLVEDASYLRLKNLSIGYKLPESILKRTKVFTGAKFFLTGRNLITVTNYLGPDPEVDSNITNGVNPNTKQYTLGVELTF
jgi:TonB-linked SusC/RagA family outer membrane protein